jgi:hypothetical protein
MNKVTMALASFSLEIMLQANTIFPIKGLSLLQLQLMLMFQMMQYAK